MDESIMNYQAIYLAPCGRRCSTCFDHRITAAADRAVRMCERARPRASRAKPQPDARIEHVQTNPQLTPGFGKPVLLTSEHPIRPLPHLSPGPRRPT